MAVRECRGGAPGRAGSRQNRPRTAVAERAQLSLRVAGWLAEHGMPAVRPAAGVAPEVVLVDGHPVSFWEPLPEPVRPARAVDLALLLRMLHALPAPPFALPRRELLANVPRWLAPAARTYPPPTPPFCAAAPKN